MNNQLIFVFKYRNPNPTTNSQYCYDMVFVENNEPIARIVRISIFDNRLFSYAFIVDNNFAQRRDHIKQYFKESFIIFKAQEEMDYFNESHGIQYQFQYGSSMEYDSNDDGLNDTTADIYYVEYEAPVSQDIILTQQEFEDLPPEVFDETEPENSSNIIPLTREQEEILGLGPQTHGVIHSFVPTIFPIYNAYLFGKTNLPKDNLLILPTGEIKYLKKE